MKCWLAAQETEPAEAVVASLVRHIRFEVMDDAGRSLIADEPLMQKLALMKIMALTAGGVRPARTGKIPVGVQLSLPASFLDGWTQHFDEGYGHETFHEHLLGVPSSAKWIFVGARDPEGNITIGAVGARDKVLQETPRNSPHDHNGVAWYLTPNASFGFAPAGCTVSQNEADSGLAEEQGESRLSWHLGGSTGIAGWRAGSSEGLDGEEWRKLLYYK